MTAIDDKSPTTDENPRGMTLWPATALVTGTIIGAGIFTQPTVLAEYGPISLVGFFLTALGSIALALVFARLARRSPDVGGPYAFARHGFGDFVGFQSAWTYWIGAWVAVGAIASSMVLYLGVLIPPVVDNTWASAATAIGVIVILTWINGKGAVTGAKTSLVLTILKIVPLLLIGTLGFIAFNPDNLGPFNGSGLPAVEVIAAVMAYTLFSFIGVEAATIPAGDVHEPDKTIPRATMIGTIAAAVVYLLSTAAVFGAVPNEELSTNDAAFSVAAENMFGSWAGPVVALLAVISCLGAMNGLLLLSGQIPMAAEFDGLAPKIFGKLNIHRAPATGLLISAVLAAALLLLQYSGGSLGDAVKVLVLVSAVATMVSYIFSAGAEIKWLLIDRGKVNVKHLARHMSVALIALAFCLFAFYGGGESEIYWLFMIIMIGVPLYLFILWRRQKEDSDTTDTTEPFSI